MDLRGSALGLGVDAFELNGFEGDCLEFMSGWIGSD